MEKKDDNEKLDTEFEKAEYSKEEVSQMRANGDEWIYRNLYDVWVNAGDDVLRGRHVYVWENGFTGYFVKSFQFKHGDNFKMMFWKHQKGDHKLPAVDPLDAKQRNVVLLSGFGVAVLLNWGKDLLLLCEEYTKIKYQEYVSLWSRENYPKTANKQTELQLLNELKEAEMDKWNKSTVSDFFTSSDNEKLNQCMTAFFNWLDNSITVIQESKEENTSGADSIQESQESNDKKIGKRPPKMFSKFLICNNKDELMKKLHELLDFNPSGKGVAMILECLVDDKRTSENSRLVNSAITEFHLECKNQSINDYYLKRRFTDKEKQPIISLFN